MLRSCCFFPLLGILTTANAVLILAGCSQIPQAEKLIIHLQPDRLPADGISEASLTIRKQFSGTVSDVQPRLELSDNLCGTRMEHMEPMRDGWHAQIRAGILPGEVRITAKAPGFSLSSITLTLDPFNRDEFHDGTPDFLRLNKPEDQAAFLHWFTFLAEIQYFTSNSNRSTEIVDCSALLRYAYRESMKRHDSAWCSSIRVPLLPAFNSVKKYAYPQTPLGMNLFRLRAGTFGAPDSRDGAFGQFANAETLQKFNTFFISRNIRHAHPGDLLFYRRPAEHIPFHSMIFVGRSQITPGETNYVVYDTGPDGTKTGEVRRRSVEELLNYPDPQWQPKWTNPNFLGVFRWNILRTAS